MTLEELKECLNNIPPEFNKTEVDSARNRILVIIHITLI